MPIEGASPRPRFHLAIPVDDLDAADSFYGGVLGCKRGRDDAAWIDWDLYGHQLVTHLVTSRPETKANLVDGDQVPVPHFGVILSVDAFHQLERRLRAHQIDFAIPPHVRFLGESGEQWTMFFFDPAGNAIEYKAFADDDQVFATE